MNADAGGGLGGVEGAGEVGLGRVVNDAQFDGSTLTWWERLERFRKVGVEAGLREPRFLALSGRRGPAVHPKGSHGVELQSPLPRGSGEDVPGNAEQPWSRAPRPPVGERMP